MNDAFYKELVEASWHRKLTPAEEAQLQSWLAIHPEEQAHWEEEVALNDFLKQLPQAPLSSNFTAQVMQAFDAETREIARLAEQPWWMQWARRLAPKLAAAGLVLICGLVILQQQHQPSQGEAIRDVVSFAEVAQVLPNPVILQDFDTIKNLRSASDEELLAVLQQ